MLLRVVAISDTHCRHNTIHLPKGDVLLHAGDVSLKGRKSEIVDFLSWFCNQPFKHKIFIAGNHDFYFEKEKKSEIEKIIPKGVIYLNDSGTTVDGINVWGSPVTPWFHKWAFNRKRGASISKHWDLIPGDTDILVSHGPAYGILDTAENDEHIGCKDLLKRIEEIKPKVVVSGHIHESYGMVNRKGIKFINACILNENYDIVHKPLVFDIVQ